MEPGVTCVGRVEPSAESRQPASQPRWPQARTKETARESHQLVRRLGATGHSRPVPAPGFEPDIIVECSGVGPVIADVLRAAKAGGTVCLTGSALRVPEPVFVLVAPSPRKAQEAPAP